MDAAVIDKILCFYLQGYGDTEYKKRREFIAQVAQNYR